MGVVNDVRTHLLMASRINEFIAEVSSRSATRLEELQHIALEELALNPDSDISQHAYDIASILEAGPDHRDGDHE